jgi:ankyrin repeat protein
MALPIHLAAQRGLAEAVRLLASKGASVDGCDDNGYTALHLAAYHGHVAVVDVLLQLGAHPGHQGPDDGDRRAPMLGCK